MERPVPFNLDAERAVLGSCLMEREAILVVRNLVSTDEFFLERHAVIYEAILACLEQRQPPDMVTVAAQLRQAGQLEFVGGGSFLGELLSDIPTAIHADHYARIVRRTARARRLIELGAHITAAAYDESRDPDAVIEEAEQRLIVERAAGACDEDWQGQVFDGRDLHARNYPPRPNIIEGILPIGPTIVHGLPKTKKSWFSMGLSYSVACGGMALGQLQAQRGEVLYIDLEMDEELENERLKVLYPRSTPPEGVKFVFTWPTIEGGAFFNRLDSYLRARPYTRLVVVDTLVRVFPEETRDGYRQDAKLIDPFRRFCAGRGIGMLLIYHSRKLGGSGDPILGASGSTGITGSVDTVLELRNDETEPSKGMLLRRGRRLRDDSKMHLKWDVQLGTWAINQKAGIITPERKAIIEVVQEHGPMSTQKIAAILERPAPSIRRMCAEMLTCGQLLSMQGLYMAPESDMA
jgi:hypothetical protein